MNYQYHYDELIRKYGRNVKPSDIYTEGHHIIPKSMGGSDESDNITYLTAREHYLAHFLLWKIHNNFEMTYAFRFMNCGKDKLIGSTQFKRLREEYSKFSKEHLSGRKNTEDQMRKQTEAVRSYYRRIGSKGKQPAKGVWSEEAKKAQSKRMSKSHHRAKKVSVDGKTYHSLRNAAKAHNVSHRTIKRWFSSGRAFYTGKE
jgi:hypothetical protein